jgi:hypothetical protein
MVQNNEFCASLFIMYIRNLLGDRPNSYVISGSCYCVTLHKVINIG